MAYQESQPEVSIVANTTFANSDLYKLVGISTDGQVVIGATTASDVFGTLLSVTGTTSGAGIETVTVGLFQGIGKVNMAASTRDRGQTVAASSAGLGIAPTTDAGTLGIALDGSSGSAGRIFSVLFGSGFNVEAT